MGDSAKKSISSNSIRPSRRASGHSLGHISFCACMTRSGRSCSSSWRCGYRCASCIVMLPMPPPTSQTVVPGESSPQGKSDYKQGGSRLAVTYKPGNILITTAPASFVFPALVIATANRAPFFAPSSVLCTRRKNDLVCHRSAIAVTYSFVPFKECFRDAVCPVERGMPRRSGMAPVWIEKNV